MDDLNGMMGEFEDVEVERISVVTTLLQKYAKPMILGRRLHVAFHGEIGIDAGGLTKDLFMCFWEAAFQLFFIGQGVFVPFLPVHRYGEALAIFAPIGRILSHMVALTRTLPIRLSRCALFTILHGRPCETEYMLIEDFLRFVTEYERYVIKKGLSGYRTLQQREIDHLTDMFSRFGLSVLPSESNFENSIINLAKSELSIKPMYLCQAIKSGIPEVFVELFFKHLDQVNIDLIYRSLEPSPSKVVDKLIMDTEHPRPEEDTIFYSLKDWVYSLSPDDISLFLGWVTGADVLPSLPITVMFHRGSGLSSHPVARTCGNVLELPSTYTSTQEFRRELNMIIHEAESFQMHMA